MIDLMDKQVAKMEQCRMLVLDEADKLLSQDFKGMLDTVISRLVSRHFKGYIHIYPVLYTGEQAEGINGNNFNVLPTPRV